MDCRFCHSTQHFSEKCKYKHPKKGETWITCRFCKRSFGIDNPVQRRTQSCQIRPRCLEMANFSDEILGEGIPDTARSVCGKCKETRTACKCRIRG